MSAISSTIWVRCASCWSECSTSVSSKKGGNKKVSIVQCCFGKICIFCENEFAPVKCLFCPNFNSRPSICVWKTSISDLRALNSTIAFKDWEHYRACLISFYERFGERATNMQYFLRWAGEHHPGTIIRWFNFPQYDDLLLFFNKLMSLFLIKARLELSHEFNPHSPPFIFRLNVFELMQNLHHRQWRNLFSRSNMQIMKFLAFRFAVETKYDLDAKLKGCLPYYGHFHGYCARMFLSILTKKVMRQRVCMTDYERIRV
jgi:hypothetical protein